MPHGHFLFLDFGFKIYKIYKNTPKITILKLVRRVRLVVGMYMAPKVASSTQLLSVPLTLFRRAVFFKIGEMATNQKVLSNRASDKSRVSRVGSIVAAVSIAFQKGGTLYTYQKILTLYTRL